MIGRKPTLLFVAVLCVGQFVWTCYAEQAALGGVGIGLAVAAVVLALLGLERLRAWGKVLGRESPGRVPHFISDLDAPHPMSTETAESSAVVAAASAPSSETPAECSAEP